MKTRIQGVRYTAGKTRTDRALRLASEVVYKQKNGERPSAHDVMLVVTDGKTAPESTSYPTVLAPLKVCGRLKLIVLKSNWISFGFGPGQTNMRAL